MVVKLLRFQSSSDRNLGYMLCNYRRPLRKPAIWGVSQKWWYPTSMGFPTENDHFGVFWGYHHSRKHPYIYTHKDPNIGMNQRWQKWFMSWAVTISPWLVRLGWKTTQLCGDYIAINHEKFSILSFSTTRIQWNVMRCQFSNCQVLHLLGKLFKIRALALWTRVLWNEGALEGLGSLVDELCFYWRGVVWWCHHHISFYKWVTICFKDI